MTTTNCDWEDLMVKANKEDGNTKTRIIDAEGIRIGDLALDYDTRRISMWNDLEWIGQDLTKEDMRWLIDALIMCYERS